mgnify:CR=1 FL=1
MVQIQMKSNSTIVALLAGVLCVGAFVLGANAVPSSNYTTSDLELNIDWESEKARTCVLKLMGYSSSRYGSSYYLLDITRDGKTLLKFDVHGRQKPKVHLGAPVKTQCIVIDGELYAHHENEKNEFVESTLDAETNRLWVADEDMIRQMNMQQPK